MKYFVFCFLFVHSLINCYESEVIELPKYDFIVVGAGSAGSALVGELLRNMPKKRILLIEAGTDQPNENIKDFQKATSVYGTQYDWSNVLVPQVNFNNRIISLTQGKSLGGSSLLNGMVWFHGNENDYNDWAASANDSTWSFANVLPILKEIES